MSHLLGRYLNNQIYTYIGDILIAINPLKTLGLYGPEVRRALIVRLRLSVDSRNESSEKQRNQNFKKLYAQSWCFWLCLLAIIVEQDFVKYCSCSSFCYYRDIKGSTCEFDAVSIEWNFHLISDKNLQGKFSFSWCFALLG